MQKYGGSPGRVPQQLVLPGKEISGLLSVLNEKFEEYMCIPEVRQAVDERSRARAAAQARLRQYADFPSGEQSHDASAASRAPSHANSTVGTPVSQAVGTPTSVGGMKRRRLYPFSAEGREDRAFAQPPRMASGEDASEDLLMGITRIAKRGRKGNVLPCISKVCILFVLEKGEKGLGRGAVSFEDRKDRGGDSDALPCIRKECIPL